MYIGLDLGTSGLKGLVIDDAQRVLAEAAAPLSVQRPAAGWSEQAPQDWIAAAQELRRWVYGSGIVLPGLVTRREAGFAYAQVVTVDHAAQFAQCAHVDHSCTPLLQKTAG